MNKEQREKYIELPEKKPKPKQATLRARVSPELAEAFNVACRESGVTCTAVIISAAEKFVRDYKKKRKTSNPR